MPELWAQYLCGKKKPKIIGQYMACYNNMSTRSPGGAGYTGVRREKVFVIMKIIWILFAGVFLSANVCAETINEKWVIEYSFTSGKEFPQAYIDININDGKIVGTANDLENDSASVSGSVSGMTYNFIIHPLRHGDSKGQDIEFVGIKNGSKISGQWAHAVGVKGVWSAYKTSKNAEKALKKYKKPCDKAK